MELEAKIEGPADDGDVTNTREPGELSGGFIVCSLCMGAAQSVNPLWCLEMGSAFPIFARENSWAENGQPSLQIADHPQPRPFAIRPCHSTRLEASACSRGPADTRVGVIAVKELCSPQPEGSPAQNLADDHFSSTRQSALRNKLDPGLEPLDGIPCKLHQSRAQACSSSPWSGPG